MVKITLGIDGMSCSMCEAHINDAIRRVFKVKKVTSSHKRGETVVISQEPIDESQFKSAIEPTGYKVISYVQELYEKKGLFR